MKTYTIQEIGRQTELPASTLRYYEASGLLGEVGRDAAGRRVYTQFHLDRLGSIACYKGTGMTLAQLKEFFTYEENEAEHMEEILTLLREQKQHVEERIRQSKKDYVHIQRKLDYFGGIRQAKSEGKEPPAWEAYAKKEYPCDPE